MKTIYKNICNFEAKKLVSEGKIIYCLDKKYRITFNLEKVPAATFFEVINNDKERYYLWIEEVDEEQKEEEEEL